MNKPPASEGPLPRNKPRKTKGIDARVGGRVAAARQAPGGQGIDFYAKGLASEPCLETDPGKPKGSIST